MMDTHPRLAAQWHPTRNGSVQASDVTYGSEKKVWWKCPASDDHAWQASPNSRTSKTSGCPFCSGKAIGTTNNLTYLRPDIASQWHPTKNQTLERPDPHQYAPYSNKTVWWKCPKGEDHEWRAKICLRSLGQGCPFCSHHRPSLAINLAKSFAAIAQEWHPSKNGKRVPHNFLPYSNHKAWWKCGQGHSWKASIVGRTRYGRRCPICKKNEPRVIRPRLANRSSLADASPDIAFEWHPHRNGDLKPTDVPYGSTVRVWWICKQGHEWTTKVNGRTASGSGCPYCLGVRASAERNLAVLYPEIAADWHPTKNGDLKPTDVSYGSTVRVWWICKKGHEWTTKVNGRTASGSGCPQCSPQTSRNEIRILSELKSLFPMVQSRAKVHGKEIDIFLPEHKLGIEYDGYFWHQSKEKSDARKTATLSSHGITLIRVREHPLRCVGKNDIIVRKSDAITKQTLNELVSRLRLFVSGRFRKQIDEYVRAVSFQDEKTYRTYLSVLPNPFPEHSLLSDLRLCKEFDYEKNHPLEPANISRGSDLAVHWVCPKGHAWQAAAYRRTGMRSGCPYCSKHRLSDLNRLSNLRPDIAAEWHPEKNGSLTPADVTVSQRKRAWWICAAGHEWDAMIYSRTQGGGCPSCGRNAASAKSSLPKAGDSLADRFPEVAAEWHPNKNGDVGPADVKRGSKKKVWWRCSNGHEWRTAVVARTGQGTGCPYCLGVRPSAERNLAALYPRIAAEWHPRKNGELKPTQFAGCSGKKVWWLCSRYKTHEWQTSIAHRTHNMSGCPFCARRKK